MKTLALLLSILLLPCSVSAGPFMAALMSTGGVAAPTYVFSETFDGATACGDGSHTNCDNTWGTVNGTTATVDFNQTGLEGTYSLLMDSGSAYDDVLKTGIGTGGDFHIYFQINLSTLTGGTTTEIIRFMDSGGTEVANFKKVGTTNKFRIFHGTANATPSSTPSTSTLYHVWIDYAKGTGVDGVMDLYVSTDGIKGSSIAPITTGTGQTDIDQMLIRTYLDECDYNIDKILISSTAIGDNP